MRVYAMYGHSRWVVVVASILVLGRLAVDVWVRRCDCPHCMGDRTILIPQETTLLQPVDGSSLWDFRCNIGAKGNPETYNEYVTQSKTLRR